MAKLKFDFIIHPSALNTHLLYVLETKWKYSRQCLKMN